MRGAACGLQAVLRPGSAEYLGKVSFRTFGVCRFGRSVVLAKCLTCAFFWRARELPREERDPSRETPRVVRTKKFKCEG